MSIQICAITLQGEFCSQSAPDLAAARLVGASHIKEGQWRAWDAFDVSGESSDGHRLLASYPSAESMRGDRVSEGEKALESQV